jgi:hypothetical protein
MNVESPTSIKTRQAVVQRTAEGLVEVRFTADALVDVVSIGEVIAAKRALCSKEGSDVLMCMAPGSELDVRVVHTDHHLVHGTCDNARRLAFVASDEVNARMVEIHFRYHPRPYDTEVFADEDEARKWLAGFSLS